MSFHIPNTATEELRAVLACLEIGVLTVDRSLHVYFANPAGQQLIQRGDGLRLVHGRLHASTSHDTRLLTVAVASVADRSSEAIPPGRSAVAPNPVFAVAREADAPMYRIVVAPLGSASIASAAAEAVLFVDTPHETDAATEAQVFQHAFHLTRAEARLAAHLLSGTSLTEAADKFGVAHNTVRSQLRAIFEKTRARRQADLVRLLASHLFLQRLFVGRNKNNSDCFIRSDDAAHQRPEHFDDPH
ncbi:helix-turn-helix transcriptional regulator [Rhodopila sp.]|uniref:helix-turn-helix transcriptional regulator n=1 Tax=Rhodopila sp. TaxID=2480087 RepID=UPI003D12C21E